MREQIPEGLAVRLLPGEHAAELVVGGGLVAVTTLVPVRVEGGVEQPDLRRRQEAGDPARVGTVRPWRSAAAERAAHVMKPFRSNMNFSFGSICDGSSGAAGAGTASVTAAFAAPLPASGRWTLSRSRRRAVGGRISSLDSRRSVTQIVKNLLSVTAELHVGSTLQFMRCFGEVKVDPSREGWRELWQSGRVRRRVVEFVNSMNGDVRVLLSP